MNPLVGIFSPAARRTLYTVFAVAGVCVGAIQTWCASTAADQPSWINGATAVLAYIGVALGFTAASNVPTPDTDEEGGGDEGHSDVDTVLLVLTVVGVFLLLLGVTLR